MPPSLFSSAPSPPSLALSPYLPPQSLAPVALLHSIFFSFRKPKARKPVNLQTLMPNPNLMWRPVLRTWSYKAQRQTLIWRDFLFRRHLWDLDVNGIDVVSRIDTLNLIQAWWKNTKHCHQTLIPTFCLVNPKTLTNPNTRPYFDVTSHFEDVKWMDGYSGWEPQFGDLEWLQSLISPNLNLMRFPTFRTWMGLPQSWGLTTSIWWKQDGRIQNPATQP